MEEERRRKIVIFFTVFHLLSLAQVGNFVGAMTTRIVFYQKNAYQGGTMELQDDPRFVLVKSSLRWNPKLTEDDLAQLFLCASISPDEYALLKNPDAEIGEELMEKVMDLLGLKLSKFPAASAATPVAEAAEAEAPPAAAEEMPPPEAIADEKSSAPAASTEQSEASEPAEAEPATTVPEA